jgi:hypothetical protein
MADIRYTVTIDASTGAAEIKKLEGEIDKLAGTTKKGGEEAAASTPKWQEFAKGMIAGFVSVQALEQVGRKLIGFFKDSVKEAAEAETAENNLKNALITTGRAVYANLSHFNRYAEEIQRITKYDDEEIKATQTLLLQITKLNRDGIDQATRGAIGLASVLSIDLHTATRLVTSAMEGNYGALSRYGIRVKETGSETEKQTEILGKLETMFQRARSETDTFAGSQSQLKKAVNEVKETIGKLITEDENVKKAMKEMTLIVNDLNVIMQAHHTTVIKTALSYLKNYTAARAFVEIEKAVAGEIHREADEIRANQRASEAIIYVFKELDEWLIKQGIDLAKVTGFWKRNKEETENIPPIINKINVALGQTAIHWQRALPDPKTISGVWEELLPKPRQIAIYGDWVTIMADGPKKVKKSWTESLSETATEFRDKFGGMLALASQFTTTLGLLAQNQSQAQIEALDKEYEYRRKVIENSTRSEEDKQRALDKLETEYEAKKKAMQRRAAEAQKRMATINAILNTAEAITAALATKPFLPMGPIMAVLAAAMGAVQIAAIKAQPVPLQAGAYTMGEGLAYLHPGEIVSPEEKMKETFREVIHERVQAYQPNIRIRIGEREIRDFVIDTVEQAFRRRAIGRNIIQ